MLMLKCCWVEALEVEVEWEQCASLELETVEQVQGKPLEWASPFAWCCELLPLNHCWWIHFLDGRLQWEWVNCEWCCRKWSLLNGLGWKRVKVIEAEGFGWFAQAKLWAEMKLQKWNLIKIRMLRSESRKDSLDLQQEGGDVKFCDQCLIPSDCVAQEQRQGSCTLRQSPTY